MKIVLSILLEGLFATGGNGQSSGNGQSNRGPDLG
jgi:hypothetical protein